MKWTVNISGKVRKTLNSLPKTVAEQLIFLSREIEALGPIRGNWQNYGKLDRNRHHCHLKKGKPTYVAIWEVSLEGHLKIPHLWPDTFPPPPSTT